MANIDNLNFKVIIDDKEFNKKIKGLERDAKRFNTNMSSLLYVRKASAQISQQEVENNRRALQATVDQHRAQERINREAIRTEGLQRRINAQIERGARGANKMNLSFQNVVGPFMQLAAFGGMVSLVQSIVRITGEFELQKATLGAMLNDLGAAEHLITKIKGLAVESPFTFKELTGYTKQLTAFAVPEDELFETTKMIADLSAGLGVAADRLILAYGQVKSAAFLRGQEVRQFTEAGIPILQELAEEFEKLEGRAISVGEVFDRISTRQVSFEMVAKVLREMTSEGGKFFNMQQIQADTLWGKINKLKDQWQIALNEIGKQNGTVIHNTVDSLINLVKNWEAVGKVLRTVIIAFGTYKATLLATWAVQQLITAINFVKIFTSGAVAVKGFTAALNAANISLTGLIGFAGMLAGAIYAFVTNADDATESAHDLNEELQGMHDKAIALQHEFSADIKHLQTLTRGTQDYRDAIRDINNAYGEYLPKLITEASTYEEIADAAERAKDAILEKQRQDAIRALREEGQRKLENEAKAYTDLMSNLSASDIRFFNMIASDIENRSKNWEDILKKAKEYYGENMPYQFSSKNPNPALYSDREWAIKQKEYEQKYKDALHYVWSLENLNKQINAQVNAMYSEGTWASNDEYLELQKLERERDKALSELSQKTISASEQRDAALEIEKNHLKSLIDLYTKYGNTTMADKYKKELAVLEDFWKSWRGKVQNLLMGMGYNENKSFGLWPTEYTSSTDFIDKILKDYKEVSENLEKLHFDPSTEKGLKDQKKIIEAIADLLNIDLSTGKRSGLGKSSIERQIDALSGLKKAYDELKAMNLSDATIVQMLKENFPDVVKTYGDGFIESLDYSNRILKFAQELKKTERDKAINILKTLGLDNLSNDKKEIKDAIDAAKKYFEAIRKWQTSDFNLDGSGIAYEIGKVANELQNKFNDIDLRAQKTFETLNQIDLSDAKAVEAVKNTFEKEFGEGSWDTFYEEFVKEGEDAIKLFAEKQARYERKIAQEKLNNLASRYVKDSLEGVDMSHWGDKSIRQIEAIRQRLAELMSGKIELPESTIAALRETGLKTAELQAAIRELFGEQYDTATTEKFKALGKVINQTSDIAKTLGDDLQELGKTLGNDMIVGLGKSLQAFEQLANIMTECDSLMQSVGDVTAKSMEDIKKEAEEVKAAKLAGTFESIAESSDFLTIILKLAASLISTVVNGINDSQQALRDAEVAALAYANALKNIEYQEMQESFEGIFGTNEYQQAVNAWKMAAKYQRDIAESQDKISTSQKEINQYAEEVGSTWGQYSKSARDAWEEIKNLGKGDILVDARNGWQKFWGTGNDLVGAANISDFFDEEGMLKGEELREWLKMNGEHISEDNKDILETMLNDYDLYVQAVEDANAYLSNIFGNVADDMADKFIEAFKASGEAALDYADIMDGVATDIAKSVIKSMLIDNIFTPAKVKEVTDLFMGGDRASALAVVDEVMKSAQALAPVIQALLEELKPYFQMGEEAKSSLGNGIKGITEDTANLLASYLNAIRADVSYSKTLWERMDANTQQIATILAGFSAPTLMDYQKRIEANTADIAFNTQRILSELQSVMTSEGGPTAIRVYS